MYMLSAHRHTATYSSSTITASAMACIAGEENSLNRFIDILENMEDGEVFVGTNFVVQFFKKENKNAEN